MPRTKLTERYSQPKRPPIDWLRAAVLERIAVLDYSSQQLADLAGLSYDGMRRYLRMSPWDWPEPLREKICKELGITPLRGVAGMPMEASRGDL